MERIYIFSTLTLLIYEHGMSLSLFRILQFLWSAFCSFSLKFLCILLDLHVFHFLRNINYSTFSVHICSLLVYKNRTELCVYLVSIYLLLLGEVFFFSFLVKSWGLSTQTTMLSTIRTVLILPFWSVCPLFTFLALLHFLALQPLWLRRSVRTDTSVQFSLTKKAFSLPLTTVSAVFCTCSFGWLS